MLARPDWTPNVSALSNGIRPKKYDTKIPIEKPTRLIVDGHAMYVQDVTSGMTQSMFDTKRITRATNRPSREMGLRTNVMKILDARGHLRLNVNVMIDGTKKMQTNISKTTIGNRVRNCFPYASQQSHSPRVVVQIGKNAAQVNDNVDIRHVVISSRHA